MKLDLICTKSDLENRPWLCFITVNDYINVKGQDPFVQWFQGSIWSKTTVKCWILELLECVVVIAVNIFLCVAESWFGCKCVDAD